jgi:hypothetical protein
LHKNEAKKYEAQRMNQDIGYENALYTEKTFCKFKPYMGHLLIGNRGCKKTGPDEKEFADFLGKQDREIKQISAQDGNEY